MPRMKVLGGKDLVDISPNFISKLQAKQEAM